MISMENEALRSYGEERMIKEEEVDVEGDEDEDDEERVNGEEDPLPHSSIKGDDDNIVWQPAAENKSSGQPETPEERPNDERENNCFLPYSPSGSLISTQTGPASSALSPSTSYSVHSPVPSPPPAPPPLLFQPFLPANKNTARSVIPFSIDNILKPTFGQRLRLLQSVAVAAAAAAQRQHSRQQPQSTFQPKIKVEPSPYPELISSSNGHNNNNRPVDLSSKSGGTSSPDKTSDPSSESPLTKKEDGDCPPGMVRGPNGQLWPAWVFCTRYSDRPSSGPRSRKVKKTPQEREEQGSGSAAAAEKRPRTAFSSEQLGRLKREFDDNRYLTEERRKNLANELGLNDNQIKIWFQNKRAKIKKSTGQKGELAQMLAAQGLYNHSTVAVDDDDNPLF